MPSSATTPVLVLVAVVGLVVAAVLTRPTPSTPDVAAVPVPDPAPSTPDDPAATTSTEQPATRPSEQPAMRPSEPTGKPGGTQEPAFDGALTAAQLPVLRDAPPLEDLDGWLQADGLDSLDELRGDVVVLQFWTFSCSNCRATIPNLQALRDAHAERGDLSLVGVHYPEFAFEEDPAAITDAAADLGVTWPIALDTRGRSFHAWQEGSSGYWPRTYVLDRDGRIRFDHVGEGRYEELNATVAALLAET